MSQIITLLSDFGAQDTYVGVMKGIILQRCPTAQLVDLTHTIAPQNLMAARFHLLTAYRYFPKNSVHLAVVDPGVGSQRRSIAVKFGLGYLVGPDNGIFSGLLQSCPPIAAVELTNSDYWLSPEPSRTFHGRDIFAPAAAHLTAGGSLHAMGTSIELSTLTTLTVPEPSQTEAHLVGTLQHIDHFGNLITNIPGEWTATGNWQVLLARQSIPVVDTYSDVARGELAACVGSHGWIEILVNTGSAWERLRPQIGDQVEARLRSSKRKP